MCILDKNIYFKATNHPVHILDREGNISPSSFIPFCSFGDDMKTMGKEINGFNDPVCDSFEAKIRNDQLCYEVDLEKYKDKKRIRKQLQSGLVLILDYNLERMSESHNPTRNSGFHRENDVQIYLDTISMLKNKTKKFFCSLI